jgi:hypothetical protein
MPCHAMHPIQDLFLEGFSYVLQIDMHFIRTCMWIKFYSCKKWVLQRGASLKDLNKDITSVSKAKCFPSANKIQGNTPTLVKHSSYEELE